MPAKPPLYDLEATVGEIFLNRVLDALIHSGQVPTSFSVQGGWRDGRLEIEENHRIDLAILSPAIFTETGDARRVGLRAEFAGKVTITTTIGAWQIQSPAGTLKEPGATETFEIPFSGGFEAIGQIQIVEHGNARHAVVSFAALDALKLGPFGQLDPGPTFTETVRRIVERIAIVELRLSFMLPVLKGLPVSLPAPLEALLDSQSGEIGKVDFKVTDAPNGDIGDDFHFLLHAKQNLGYEHYDLVHPRTEANVDVALTITARWMRQIQADFWQGGIIPRHFSDKGEPDPAGPNEVTYISLTPLNSGALRVRLRIKRTVLGIPLEAEALTEVIPYIDGRYLRLRVIDEQISLNWARETAHAGMFFILYELLLRPLLRGLNLVLNPWIDALLADFLQNQRIPVAMEFPWSQTKLSVSLNPRAIPIFDEELGLTAHLDISTH